MRNKPPVVLFIAEAFNISSKWHGNTLFNALPNNFISLWQNYPHTLLEPANHYVKGDDETDFTILGGSETMTKTEQIKHCIKSGSFFKNPHLNKFLSNASKTNGALHLFTSVSNKYNEFAILLATLKAAKLFKNYRTYIHLIINEDTIDSRNLLAEISSLNKNLEQNSLGEIASITGICNLNDSSNSQSFQKALRELVLGNGIKALSPEQGLTKKMPGNQSLNKMPTTTIFRQNKPICQINNFDNLVFLDLNNQELSKLILSFITPEQGMVRGLVMPRMLNVATPYPLFAQHFDRYQFFFKSEAITFPQLLAKDGYSQLYISDSTRILHLNELLRVPSTSKSKLEILPCLEGENYFKSVKNLNQMYRKSVSTALLSNQYDFIMIDVPFLLHANQVNNFKKSLEAIKEIDVLIEDTVKKVLEMNGCFIFTSINNQPLSGETSKFLAPFIFCLDGIRKNNKPHQGEFPNKIIYEILKKKYAMIDIAPTILDLFKIDKPSKIAGNSLLSSKILI